MKRETSPFYPMASSLIIGDRVSGALPQTNALNSSLPNLPPRNQSVTTDDDKPLGGDTDSSLEMDDDAPLGNDSDSEVREVLLGGQARDDDDVKMDVDDGASSAGECPSDNDDIEIIPSSSVDDFKFGFKRQNTGTYTVIQHANGTRKSGFIMPSTKKASSSLTKSKKKRKTRRVHEVERLPPPGSDSRRPDFRCHLRGPHIDFVRSDSKEPPEREKESYSTLDPPEVVDSQGNVNYYYRLPDNSPQVFWWKRKIGTWLAQQVLKLDDARRRRYFLQAFPDNYILYQHRNGPKGYPRTDCYLESSGKVRQFRSPEEFYEHAAWLIQKKGPDGVRQVCVCDYCKRARETRRKKIGIEPIGSPPEDTKPL